jgi:hypothetical protein
MEQLMMSFIVLSLANLGHAFASASRFQKAAIVDG